MHARMQNTYVGLSEIGMVGRIRGVSTVVGNISVVQAKFVLDDGHGSVLKAETEERRRYV